MDRGRWYTLLSHSAVLWQESGENLMLFCYLIGWGTFSMMRSGEVAPIPNTARHETDCSNPSFTSFTRFTIPRDLES